MDNSKKIFLSALIACAASSAVFAMDPDLEKKKAEKRANTTSSENLETNDGIDHLSSLPTEILISFIFPNLIKQKFYLNTPEGIYKAVKYLISLRRISKQFNVLLSNENIGAILREADVDLTVKDNYGWTALHMAAKYGYADLAQILINAIPEGKQRINFVSATYGIGWTILHLAALNGHAGVAQILINAIPEGEQRINFVSAIDIYHETALYFAARDGHARMAQILVDAYEQHRIQIPQDLLPQLRKIGVTLSQDLLPSLEIAEIIDCTIL